MNMNIENLDLLAIRTELIRSDIQDPSDLLLLKRLTLLFDGLKTAHGIFNVRVVLPRICEGIRYPCRVELQFKHGEDWYSAREISLAYPRLRLEVERLEDEAIQMNLTMLVKGKGRSLH